MLKAKLLGATAGAEAALAIEDVFSTYLYTGGTAQQINNGIDLDTEGGMVWIKRRNSTFAHQIFDTQRTSATYGTPTRLSTNTASAADVYFTTGEFSWLADGFDLNNTDGGVNGSGGTYASWTFRKAPRFFDVVTYTGTGANRTIAHDLGVVPGCIIVKRTNTTGDWQVYHRSNANTEYMVLNDTAAKATGATRWNSTTPTSSVFSLGTSANVNASGSTYVAYLFAHDPLGPSGDGSDGLIACGSYTTDGSGNATVDLGWEPQWVLWKASSAADNWAMFDNMRGTTDTSGQRLIPNGSFNEDTVPSGYRTPFSARGFRAIAHYANQTHIYIAIRRGPMREPTVGTQVFGLSARTGTGANATVTGGQTADAVLVKNRGSAVASLFSSRMTGTGYLVTSTTAAEVSAGTTILQANPWDVMDGVKVGTSSTITNASGNTFINYLFRRAPGFFDVVAYTGTGANRTISHNLGAVPELMIVKKRSAADNWVVYAGDATDYLILNAKDTTADLNTMWNDTAPTSSVFSLGTNDDVNGNTATFISYLFASLPGISKVGSYTGNGSSQTINCGFTTGARFVLIKRTDALENWHVFDTARGINAGDDPALRIDSEIAEFTSAAINPNSSGFEVVQSASCNNNVNAASYIYLAIA